MVSLRIITDVALLDQDSPEVRKVIGIIKTLLAVSQSRLSQFAWRHLTLRNEIYPTFLRRKFSEEFERNTRESYSGVTSCMVQLLLRPEIAVKYRRREP